MIALIGIMVQDETAVEKVNTLLHEYRDCVVGRMGLPLRDDNLSVISLVLKTDTGRINGLCGKLGSISGVKSKAVYNVVG